MQFTEKLTSKISAQVTGSTEKITLDGLTIAATTPENAKAQMDKILHIVNKAVNTSGMIRTITQEATE